MFTKKMTALLWAVTATSLGGLTLSPAFGESGKSGRSSIDPQTLKNNLDNKLKKIEPSLETIKEEEDEDEDGAQKAYEDAEAKRRLRKLESSFKEGLEKKVAKKET